MNKEYCEKVRLSAMAISDGEQPLVPENEITSHLESCNDCRIAVEQLHSAAKMLEDKKRQAYDINIVHEVEAALKKSNMQPKYSDYSRHFAALCFALFILKIFDVSSALATVGIARFLPVIVVTVFFILIKQNPFTINPNIQLKGELK